MKDVCYKFTASPAPHKFLTLHIINYENTENDVSLEKTQNGGYNETSHEYYRKYMYPFLHWKQPIKRSGKSL